MFHFSRFNSDLSELSSGIDVTSQITFHADVYKKLAILHGKVLHLMFSAYTKTIVNATVVATLPESMTPINTGDMSSGNLWRGSGCYINNNVVSPIQINTRASDRTVIIANHLGVNMTSPYGEIWIELE